jgi:hypothetical protein
MISVAATPKTATKKREFNIDLRILRGTKLLCLMAIIKTKPKSPNIPPETPTDVCSGIKYMLNRLPNIIEMSTPVYFFRISPV